MPSELEEVVVDADALEAQHLAPDARQQLFGGSARRGIAPVAVAADHRLGFRQGPAIDLAGGRQRKARDEDEDSRHHVAGESRRELLSQHRLELRWSRVGLLARSSQVGHELVLLRRSGPRHHHHFADLRVARQLGLDLAQLDAESADLDLVVEAPEKLDPSVGRKAGQVTDPVEPFARLAQRVGNELLGGQSGAVDVPPRQSRSGGTELSGGPHRHRPLLGIENENGGVLDRPADRDGVPDLGKRAHRIAAGEGRILGRAVAVDQCRPGQRAQHGLHVRHREHVAAGQELLDRGQGRQALFDHLVKERRGQPQGTHALALEHRRQLMERQLGFREQHHPAAMEQGPPDLEGRGIEGDRRQLQEDLLAAEAGVVGVGHQAHHRAVAHPDSFGPAGRARGVHDVGEIVQCRPGLGPRMILDGLAEAHDPRSASELQAGGQGLSDQHHGRR